MTAAVEAKGLFRVHFSPEGNSAALQGLSFSAGVGEIVTILGPSGAGKTTLLRLIAGLERPSAGSIRVFGTEVSALKGSSLSRYRASTLGYLDQHYDRALAPELTVAELVGLRLTLAGVERRPRNARVDALLERVGLTSKRVAKPDELSGGEQQRVAVCAALAHNPRLLLADEPTGELDEGTGGIVYDLIRDLVQAEACTALIVSHDPASTVIADRTIRIRDGRVSEESTRAGEGEEMIVVGGGGWLRVPEEFLRRARISTHAKVRMRSNEIVISAAERSGRASEPVRGNAPRPPRQRAAGRTAELVSVTKTYGTGPSKHRAVADLTAAFDAGRFYAVTGPSGSGKSTLLHLLAGLDLSTDGEVRVLGEDLKTLDREARALLRRNDIAFIGQQDGLIPFLSGEENVDLNLALRSASDSDSARVSHALDAVGLAARSAQRVSHLSSGERARVAIARAIATNATLLIADEPTSRLDQANAQRIASLLATLARERAVTVICATHDRVVIEQADHELSLSRGEPDR